MDPWALTQAGSICLRGTFIDRSYLLGDFEKYLFFLFILSLLLHSKKLEIKKTYHLDYKIINGASIKDILQII